MSQSRAGWVVVKLFQEKKYFWMAVISRKIWYQFLIPLSLRLESSPSFYVANMNFAYTNNYCNWEIKNGDGYGVGKEAIYPTNRFWSLIFCFFRRSRREVGERPIYPPECYVVCFLSKDLEGTGCSQLGRSGRKKWEGAPLSKLDSNCAKSFE